MGKVRRSAFASVERRVAALGEVRAADGESRQFSGKAAVFNQRTAIGNPLQWGFYEEVAPGAFDKTLRESDVVFLADHDPGKPLSRMSAGTLRLSADGTALAVDADLVRTSYADDLIANVDGGNIRGMSFGFQSVKDDWTMETVSTSDGQEGEVEVRRLLEVRLLEVSTTAFPAYTGTDASMRSAVLAARGTRHGSLLAGETRAGAKLSSDTMSALQEVLDMLAAADAHVDAADDQLDAAQAFLSQFMGVPNPDPPDPEDGDDGDAADEADDAGRGGLPLTVLERRLALIRAKFPELG